MGSLLLCGLIWLVFGYFCCLLFMWFVRTVCGWIAFCVFDFGLVLFGLLVRLLVELFRSVCLFGCNYLLVLFLGLLLDWILLVCWLLIGGRLLGGGLIL